FHELAARQDVDSVVTFTPNATHRDIAVAMLDGGKNVFIEKPMGLTLEQGREVLEAEQRSGKYVAVDLEMRALGMGPMLRQIIESGEIGQVVQIDHDHYRGGWLRNTPSGDYRTRRATSGLFKMEAIHHIDLARYLLGEITKVRCFSAPNVLTHYEFPDNVTAFFEFASGAVGRYTTSHTRSGYSTGKDEVKARATGHQKQWNIVGTKGSLWIDGWTQHVNFFHFHADPPGTDSLKPEFVRRLDFSSLPNPHSWFHDIAGHRRLFLERMAEGLPPTQRAADAFRSEIVAHAADDAAQARDGKPIDIEAYAHATAT
ncbi:MAG: Gfo/Idh/MocA family oxidoreductase, partial [Phycisphaeraceae bacterium]